MAETQRTLADLISRLADNATGDVSPEDVRDIVETIRPRFGGLFITSAAPTLPSGVGVMTKASGTTTATNLHGFTMPASNRLQYNGTVAVHGHIALSVSMLSPSANNQYVRIGIAKNGVVEASSILERKIANAADVGATALHTDVVMNPGDYLEIFLANDTSTNTIQLAYGYLFCMTMPL